MTRQLKLSILVMAIGLFLCILDTTVMNIALPTIQSGLHTSLSSFNGHSTFTPSHLLLSLFP